MKDEEGTAARYGAIIEGIEAVVVDTSYGEET